MTGSDMTGGHMSGTQPSGSARSRLRARRLVGAALSAALAVGLGVVILTSGSVPGASAIAPTVSTLDGTTSSSAAASCWEIKQLFPASVDGGYWLLTSTLQRPEQFYCDMTTDGGGWVLIGRGREGWSFRDYGQQTTQILRTNVNGPAAFAPAALSTDMIDGLLDGGAVKDLADGVRVRRAGNIEGSQWQELRWNFADLTSWSWAVGGGHRLSSFSIDGVDGTGSNTKDSKVTMADESGAGNRGATNERVWFTYPWSGHGRSAGFSYGGSVSGEKNATSYLWEYGTENNAIPFTQLFIRPRLTTPVLAPIADTGLAAQTIRAQLDDRPAELAGGVWGVLKVGDSEPQVDAPVLAITTIGDRVYVGGKFSQVRDTASGLLVDRPYLAAFDRRTGAWISSFDPSLDGTVWDLDVAGGRLVVAGQFTNVDGAAATAGLAALDPITGDVDPAWRASISVTGTTQRPYARALDVDGPWIYVGGNFSSIRGSTATRSVGRLARVSVANGTPDSRFVPNIGGVVYDVDTANGRTYAVGSFTSVNGQPRQGVGVLDATSGALINGLGAPEWTTPNVARRYQQAVLAVGDSVWQGGSEHNTHAYSVGGYSIQQRYIAADQGGDTQAFATTAGTVYQASHGNAWTYRDARSWPGLEGFTRADVYNWIGAFDSVSRSYDKSFVPSLRSAYSEGAWALHADVDGCLWFGGDFNGGPYVGGTRQYLEGFSKFCPRDQTAPSAPTTPAAAAVVGGGTRVSWQASTDNAPGYLGYEVLRNDRVISGLVYARNFVDPTGQVGDRYFVRSVDPAGNRSATTASFLATGNLSPSVPTDLAAVAFPDASVDLTWTASVDDVGIAEYRVFRDGIQFAVVPGTETFTNLLAVGVGRHSLQLVAVDTTGNLSAKSVAVVVDVFSTDGQAPTTPGSPSASYDPVTKLVNFSWTPSSDNVGVAGYDVRDGGAVILSVSSGVTKVQLSLAAGSHSLQVVGRDAAGNKSLPTTAIKVDVPVSDTVNPSTPKSLATVANADGSVTASWIASTDNVGVALYRVYRNGVEVTSVPGGTTTAVVTGLASGLHYIQVQAFDQAGNASFRTASSLVTTVALVDTSNPTTPRNLTAAVTAQGAVVASWTASTDNVAVASYTVFRNGVFVASVAGGTTTITLTTLGTGTHYIQLQAVDAAGNVSYKTASARVDVGVVSPTTTTVVTSPPATTTPPTTGAPTSPPPAATTTTAPTTTVSTTVAPTTTQPPVTSPPADTSRPSVPTNLVVSPVGDGSITVSWMPSRDNVGVVSYRVTRNRTEVAAVAGNITTAVVAGLGPGLHYIQVYAIDAASNESIRTASVTITL